MQDSGRGGLHLSVSNNPKLNFSLSLSLYPPINSGEEKLDYYKELHCQRDHFIKRYTYKHCALLFIHHRVVAAKRAPSKAFRIEEAVSERQRIMFPILHPCAYLSQLEAHNPLTLTKPFSDISQPVLAQEIHRQSKSHTPSMAVGGDAGRQSKGVVPRSSRGGNPSGETGSFRAAMMKAQGASSPRDSSPGSPSSETSRSVGRYPTRVSQ